MPFLSVLASTHDAELSFLHQLAGLRFPILTSLMQLITVLGEETVFMVVAIVMFWCIDKWRGYFLLSTGFVSTIFNQFLKLVFRVPRPWTYDEKLIVPSAKEGAGGYSFPSGHSQNAVTTFGGVARSSKYRWVRIVCLVLIVLIAFSRMYLGAHFPSDVLVALLIGTVLIFVMYSILNRAKNDPKVMYVFLGVMLAISVAYLLYVKLWKFPADIDQDNYRSGLKNAYTLLGSLLAMVVVYTVDHKKLRFDEKAPLLGQILKVVLGVACVLAIRIGLAKVFAMISDHLFWNAVRYFCIAGFAGAVWPWTFPLWKKIGAKKDASSDAKEGEKTAKR